MTADQPEQRLRRPPAERFAGSAHAFSLDEELLRLRAEDHPARNGHRQKALLQRDPVTKILFDFEQGGFLKEHQTRGLVTIHVLEGLMDVEAEGTVHALSAGEVLVLDPEVPHSVRAAAVSAMLLTVTLEPKDEG